MSELRLFLFGSPRLFRTRKTRSAQADQNHVEQLRFSRRRAMALLAYLAVTGKHHPREVLAGLFWPESDPALAHSYLRRELAILNKTLGQGWLDSDREVVGLIRRDDFWLDVAHFRHLLSTWVTHGHPENEVCPQCLPVLAEAVDLYCDSFMAGFSLADTQNFTEWQFFECEELQRRLSQAFNKLVQGYMNRQEFEPAIHYAQRWLHFEPAYEVIHRQLMQLFAWTSNRAAAIHQYQSCVRVLKEEMDQSPEAATQALYEAIKTQTLPWEKPEKSERPAHPSPAPESESRSPHPLPPAALEEKPTVSPLTPRHNLPPEPTPFFGREEELVQIGRLLLGEPACRMLTLVGPGGIGKTRLAVQAAKQALDAFPHGVYLVSLASVSSATLLAPTIAEVLKFSFEGRADLNVQLLNHLRQKTMLLVLDNFEHMLSTPLAGMSGDNQGAEQLLLDFLRYAPNFKLLVTSRERLNLKEEWVLEIGGLAYPSATEMPQPAPIRGASLPLPISLEEYSAVKLFVETARRSQPKFFLSKADQAAIVHICQLVQGMPLGIELASAWAGLMPVAELAQEIRKNLDFLGSSMRNMPDRHRSLRALFEHSWQLLSGPERQLMSKLSVFRGKFGREAAEQVANATLPLLKSLVDKSMLRGSASGRYEMHEVLRQYAAEKLAESPENSLTLKTKHSRYYAAFLRQQEHALQNLGQRQPLAKIATEIDNVSAAWDWAVAHGQVAEIGQSLDTLYRFYYAQGWIRQGEAAFKQAVEGLGGASGPAKLVLGQLLARRGHFTYSLGLYRQAKKLLSESLAIFTQFEAQNDPVITKEKALAQYHLAATARVDGEYQQARQLCQESLRLYQAGADYSGMAVALKLLGIIAGSIGDYEEARGRFHEALELYRRIDDLYGVANTLSDLGIVADRLGQYDAAKQLHQECLAIRRQTGHLWGIGSSLNNLGLLAYDQGEYAEARELIQESLNLQEEIGDQYQIANCLTNLGMTLCVMEDYLEARRCLVKALKYAVEIGSTSLILEILVEVATLLNLSQPGQREWAARLFAFVCRHPSTETLAKEKAAAGLAELAAHLAPEVISSIRALGEASQLEMVVAEILAEMDVAGAAG